ERRDDLGLGDRVERAPALVEQQGDVGERLQPRPELRAGPADALGDRADLARSLREDADDLVGFPQLDRTKNDALFLVERHSQWMVPRRSGPSVEGARPRDEIFTAGKIGRAHV